MNTSTIEPTAGAQRLSRPPAAVAAAVGSAGLAGFELALALGAPLGRAAMGGAHSYLPAGLRIASGALTVIWALAALLVLRRAGYRVPVFSARVARIGTWAPRWHPLHREYPAAAMISERVVPGCRAGAVSPCVRAPLRRISARL